MTRLQEEQPVRQKDGQQVVLLTWIFAEEIESYGEAPW
jgi:hypothetical protein